MKPLVLLLALFGAFYFVAGVLLGEAADQPWSSIHYGKRIVWSQLPVDARRVSFRDAGPTVTFGLAPLVGLVFIAALAVQLLPARYARDLRILGPIIALLFVALLPALFGAVELFWTVINAVFLRGVDGEWIDEGGPIFEGVFIVVSALALSLQSRLVPRVAPKAV